MNIRKRIEKLEQRAAYEAQLAAQCTCPFENIIILPDENAECLPPRESGIETSICPVCGKLRTVEVIVVRPRDEGAVLMP